MKPGSDFVPAWMTRDAVLDAIERHIRNADADDPAMGLCDAFARNAGAYELIPEFLTEIGAAKQWWRCCEIFWPADGNIVRDRLMMLAFMLTWAEEAGQ